jgi:hypothetical protein
VRLGLLHPANRTPHRVDLDALAAVLAPQVLVEEPLEPGLAHHLAAAVATLLELLVARLAHVAQEMGGEPAVRVHALGLDLGDDARKLELPFLDLGDVGERETPAHPHRQERVGRHLGHRLGQLLKGNAQQRGDAPEDRVARLVVTRQLAGDERQREGRPVVDQRHPVAVEEDAARRRDRPDTDPVLVRRVEEPPALQYLEIPELPDQDEEREDRRRRDHQDALAPGIASTRERAAGHAHDGSPAKRSRTTCEAARLSTTAAPTNPLKTACGSTT